MEAETRNFDSNVTLTQETRVIEQSVPEYSYSALLIYRFIPGWQVSLLASRFEDMEWLGDGQFVEGYTKVDLNLAWETQLEDTAARFVLTVQGIGDEYQDFRRENIADTEYFASLSLQF
jgi:hypothetical protein